MKKFVICLIAIGLISISFGCASPYSYKGGAAGAGVGGIAGAMLDRKNPWRGAVKGAILGGVLGAGITEASAQAARDAAINNRPVRYVSEDNRRVYVAEPVGNPYGQTKCRKVRERVWENGQLSGDRLREVCTGNITERRY